MFNNCLTKFLKMLPLTRGSWEGLAAAHQRSLTPPYTHLCRQPPPRVMQRLVVPLVFPAAACPLVSSTKKHSTSSQGLSTCSVLCPSNTQPGPGAVPRVASQLFHAVGMGCARLCPEPPQPANVHPWIKYISARSPALPCPSAWLKAPTYPSWVPSNRPCSFCSLHN